MLAIDGAVVTIDAMGASATSPRKSRQEGRLHPRPQRHQGTLREDVELSPPSRRQTASRTPRSPGMRRRWRPWPHREQNLYGDPRCGLAAGTPPMARIARRRHFESQREIPGPAPGADTIERERASISLHYCGSPPQLGAIRAHWMVGNGLHWVMDMNFPRRRCRVRTDHAPANFTTISICPQPDPKSPARIPSASAAKSPLG